jgi:hypothetical protein
MRIDPRSLAPKFDDRLKALLSAVSNLLFLIAVVAIWGSEQPLIGRHQLSGSALVAFTIWELALIAYYGALAVSDDLGALPRLLTNAIREGVASTKEAPGPSHAAAARRPLRVVVASNLWLPVTLNFASVGWLIFASGGIANSPYNQVPVAMILIGQSLYAVPPMVLTSESRTPWPIMFVSQVMRLYWSSITVVAVLLTTLLLLQRYDPMQTRAAPPVEILLVMLASLIASMGVTFVTRRADRNARGPRG